MKHIITITGIRPDFIRMSEIFKKLDSSSKIKHTLIHTGQHFSDQLSSVFFKDLDIRNPDLNMNVGQNSNDHFDQLANLTLKIKEHQDLIRSANVVLFLGDSNSVLASIPIKKMGIKVAHIEAGMRSGDVRMLEETNRKVCDHCSSFLFTYHKNYSKNLYREGIFKGVYTVGNTIKEVITKYAPSGQKRQAHILVDIHRPENFLYSNWLQTIINYANEFGLHHNIPVYLLEFPRTKNAIEQFGIDLKKIEIIPLQGFRDYLDLAYHSRLVLSDSGTAQEELSLLKVPVVVPRDYTERPESYYSGCSVQLNANSFSAPNCKAVLEAAHKLWYDTTWLGDGNTSDTITKTLEDL